MNDPEMMKSAVDNKRSRDKRIFTPAEEEALAAHIGSMVKEGRHVITKALVKVEAIKFYKTLHPHSTRQTKHFSFNL